MKIPSSIKNVIYFALVLLFLVSFVVFSHSFSVDYKQLKSNGAFQYSKHPSYLRGGQQPSTLRAVPLTIDSIEGWMTFAYINKILNLQSDILKTELKITDSKYPNLTISKAASEQRIVESVYVQSVKDFVLHYASSTPQ